jgi:CheY-like chemotaxis protein
MADSRQKTILIVEDEAIIAMTQKAALEQYGYTVLCVNSGEKAVETVKNTAGIHLILMDIDLGKGIDGTEAAALILEDRDIPVVFARAIPSRKS